VAVCAIFKNEAMYIKEWIEFHMIIGVSHFYLYNNFSEDNYKEVLKPYVDKGLVTLIEWPVKQGQIASYKDCIEKYSKDNHWIAFIDLDEYIIPNETDDICTFLKKFENRPVLLAYWRYFGSSGMKERDTSGLVTEDFVVSWRKYADIGKCIYNTNFGFDANDSRNHILNHFMWGGIGSRKYPPVNVFGKVCLPGYNPIPKSADPSHFPLQINHYFTKSYNEYLEKKKRGDAFFKQNPRTFEYFHEHDCPCQSVDYHAYKYMVKLKLAMQSKDERK